MGGIGWRGIAVVGVVLFGSGCFEPPAEAVERLAALKAENAEFDRAFESIEERFLGNQHVVLMWAELARRHQAVSALACENAATHLAGMAKHYEKLEEKARKLKKRRLASAAQLQPVLTRGRATRRN